MNTINSLQVGRHCFATLLVVDNVLGTEGETTQQGKSGENGRRARISLKRGSSFLFPIFKSNGTPTGVPDFSYIPNERKKKPIPPQIHTTGRGNQRQEERQRSEKRDPIENLFYNHNSTIAVETDSRNLSVMSYTVAHIIPSFQSNCLSPSFFLA